MTGAPDDPIVSEARPSSARPRRHLFGAALTVTALVTVFAIGLVFLGVPGGLLKQGGGHGSLTRNIPVVVAAREIPRGQQIFPDMVKTSTIRATALPPNAFGKPSDVWLRGAAVAIHPNEMITVDLLEVACSGYCPIPRGMVVLNLPVDGQGPTRPIAAGDYVDVVATVNTAIFSSVQPRLVSRAIFTNVAVVRVDWRSTVRHSMTIAVSLCDAQYIGWFANNSSLKYVASSPNYAAEVASASSRCTSYPIEPAQVDARWGFSTTDPSRPGGIGEDSNAPTR